MQAQSKPGTGDWGGRYAAYVQFPGKACTCFRLPSANKPSFGKPAYGRVAFGVNLWSGHKGYRNQAPRKDLTETASSTQTLHPCTIWFCEKTPSGQMAFRSSHELDWHSQQQSFVEPAVSSMTVTHSVSCAIHTICWCAAGTNV